VDFNSLYIQQVGVSRYFGDEPQGGRIDAIPQTRGLWPVIKQVTQVGIAANTIKRIKYVDFMA